MAKNKSPDDHRQQQQTVDSEASRFWKRLKRHVLRGTAWAASFIVLALISALLLLSVFDPIYTVKMVSHRINSGPVNHETIEPERLPLHVNLAFIAAEDSQFCLHWGFDVKAIRAQHQDRGGASISQQTVQNLFFLGNHSSISRLAGSVITFMLEMIMSKQRILDLYLNTNDFGDGIFGIAAAAKESFGKPVTDLSEEESAQLASLFAHQSHRNITTDEALQRHSETILNGAKLLAKDKRSQCIGG